MQFQLIDNAILLHHTMHVINFKLITLRTPSKTNYDERGQISKYEIFWWAIALLTNA